MLVFSFDPGTSSAGWAAIQLPLADEADEQPRLLGLGTYLFGAGAKTKQRENRSLRERHRRRRKRSRQRELVRLLIEAGLLPADINARATLFERDPYEIRARGLHERLDRHEFGRAICHLSKRRGKVVVQRHLKTCLRPNGFPTWGAWLWSRRAASFRHCLSVRNRLYNVGEIRPDLAPPRAALEHEFNMLWKAQYSFNPKALPVRCYKWIRRTMFGKARSKSLQPQRRDRYSGEDFPRDPLARVASRQIGKVFGSLIARFGQPDLIVIEKFGASRSGHSQARWFDRAQRSIVCRRRSSRHRLRLLKHQRIAAGGQAFCPYTGVQLDRALVLSFEVEIDHIRPVSRGGGSIDNLVLCLTNANRIKANRTPYEAFGADYRWHEILQRARRLPKGCSERMTARIPDHVVCEITSDGHLEHAMRQIINRLHKLIVTTCPTTKIRFASPNAVARMREQNGLLSCIDRTDDRDGKNRMDHRHHAIDAASAAFIAVSPFLGDAAQARLICDARKALQRAIAATRLQRGRSGLLHKKTVYGRVEEFEGGVLAVHRKPLTELSLPEIRHIRDSRLRETIQELTSGACAVARRKLLTRFAKTTGIRHLRILRNFSDAIILADRKMGRGSRVVRPRENNHVDIVSDRSGRWHIYGATIHAVRQKDWRPAWERPGCGFKLVMRLHKSDAVELDDDLGKPVIRRVARLVPSSGHIYLADPNAAGSLTKRHADPDDPFRWEIVTSESLRRRNGRAVRIDCLGEITYRRSNVIDTDRID